MKVRGRGRIGRGVEILAEIQPGRPQGLGSVEGWDKRRFGKQGKTQGYRTPTIRSRARECHCPWPRPRFLRHFLASVSPGVPGERHSDV
jgi:hypothetical protein